MAPLETAGTSAAGSDNTTSSKLAWNPAVLLFTETKKWTCVVPTGAA
jgi:hypothetical protein